MAQDEVLAEVAERIERVGVPYFVTGSMASMFFGEYRLTIDIDIVIAPEPWQVDAFCAEFQPPRFYLERSTVDRAIRTRDQFNVLCPTLGFKIDFMIAAESTFDRLRFKRSASYPLGNGRSAVFASPEDVAVKKMLFYREGKSEKHLRDIASMLQHCEGFDREYVSHWAGLYGVTDIWTAICEKVDAADA